MGMTSVSSMLRFLTPEDIFGTDEEMMRFHTKNNPADAFREFELYDYIPTIAEKLLGKFTCPEDKIMKLQYIQYEWIRMTMEIYRRNKWFSSGILYWMLNDCWPAHGWAILDYYTRPKATWYGFKRTAQPVISSIDFSEGKYHLNICSDGQKPVEGKAHLFLQPFDSKEPICEFYTDLAKISICGLGFYRLWINGKDITKGLLAPYISNPDHYCYYDEYDIKEYLLTGENVIGILLGNGHLIEYGKNTLPESFLHEGEIGVWSHNHHFLGDIFRWFITRVAGLYIVDSRHIEIRPDIISKLTNAKAHYELPDGKVEVMWEKKENEYILKISCPEAVEYKLDLQNVLKKCQNDNKKIVLVLDDKKEI